MSKMRIKIIIFFLAICSFLSAQNIEKSNTRNIINNAQITRVVKDWNIVANLISGEGETVSFFPIEITDLKTGNITKALQVDMSINCRGFSYSRSSWVDVDEISEFITFLENYVIPKLSKVTEKNKSITYIFKSKEIMVSFLVSDYNNRLSVYLKDNNIFDEQCYFWTESWTNKAQELIPVLESINK